MADDDGGESHLTYTWSVVSAPTNDSAGGYAIFDDNWTNTAKDTTVTFNDWGDYTLCVTVTDGLGVETPRNLLVAVDQTLTTIDVTPDATAVIQGGNEQFSANGYDQYEVDMGITTWTWSFGSVPGGSNSISYLGAISSTTGLYDAAVAPNAHTIADAFNVCASSGTVYGTASVVLEGRAGSPYYVDPNLSDIGYHAGYVNGEWETVTGNLTPTDYGWVSAAVPWTALAAAINGDVTVSRTSGWSDTYCFRHTEDGLLYDPYHTISMGTHSYNPATSTYEVQVNLDGYSYVTVNVTGDLLEELKVTDHAPPGNSATATTNNNPAHLVCAYASTDGMTHLDLSVVLSPSLAGVPNPGQYVHWGIYQGTTTLVEDTFAAGLTLTDIAVTPVDDVNDIAVMAWLDSNENTVFDPATETALTVDVARVTMQAYKISHNGQNGLLDHAKNNTPARTFRSTTTTTRTTGTTGQPSRIWTASTRPAS